MNKNIVVFFISLAILIIAFILDTTILQSIAVYNVKPDILLIILIFIAYKTGDYRSQFLGFIMGILKDLATTTPIGFYALIYTVITFLFSLLFGAFNSDFILLPLLFVLGAWILQGILIWFISLFQPGQTIGLYYFSRQFWIVTIYTCLVSPIVFYFLNKMSIYKQKKEEGF